MLIVNQPVNERSMLGDPDGINKVRRKYTEEELLHYVEREKGSNDFRGKEILLHLDSFCVGDTVCFARFIEPFLEYHGVKKVFVTTFFPEFFYSEDPRFQFIP